MHPKNERGHAQGRLGGALALIVLLLGLALPAEADPFDSRQGRRMLGAALASSALEHTLAGEVSTPRTTSELLLMFLINPRYNAYVLKHPQVLPSLLDRMMEPGFQVALFQGALHPEAYMHFLAGWTDMEKMRSYFEVMDPAVFLAWARTLSSPGFYLALYEPLAAPEKSRSWGGFMLGSRLPDFLTMGLNPRTYLAWLTLPFNSDLMGHLEGPLRMMYPTQWATIAGTLMQSGQQAVNRFAAPATEPVYAAGTLTEAAPAYAPGAPGHP
jgi:hypothetical protein